MSPAEGAVLLLAVAGWGLLISWAVGRLTRTVDERLKRIEDLVRPDEPTNSRLVVARSGCRRPIAMEARR